jgi:tryptophan synthase alpha chain
LKKTKTKEQGRIGRTFAALKADGKKALITFITAGDPNMRSTAEIIGALVESGADMIELGIPFSDPMADGPTIQASSERALRAGATLEGVLKLVKSLRAKTGVPVILFGYYNPILSFGLKRFARTAAASGVDGVLVVDLPPEEAADLKGELDGAGVELIFLLTPTSGPKRMRLVASLGAGFIYFVSLTGVTGARKALSKKIPAYVKKVRRFTKLPVGVGFGISTPAQARTVARSADAVVVGSALVDIISKRRKGQDQKMIREIKRFVRGLKRGMDGA